MASASPTEPADEKRVPVEQLLAPLPTWQQAAVRTAGNWPRGQLLTASEFEKIRKATLEGAIR